MTNASTKPCTKTRYEQRGRVNEQIGSRVSSFQTRDATRIRYRTWRSTGEVERAIVVFQGDVGLLDRPEFFVDERTAVFVLDLSNRVRSAKSPAKTDPKADHAVGSATVSQQAQDLEDFVRSVTNSDELDIGDLVVVAPGEAAVVLSTWVHDFAPNVRGMILVDPVFDSKSASPSGSLLPLSYDACCNHDQAVQRLTEDAPAIHCPTLMLQAENQSVSNERLQRSFFSGLSSTLKRCGLLGTELESESGANRDTAFAVMNDFIDAAFRQSANQQNLTNAHRSGFTYDEQQRLLQPLPLLSPKRWAFATQRLFLNTLGRLSKGVQIGWSTGFDSGVSLDHVYENDPRGFGWVGRAIDRVYLDSIGWKGIRQRRVHLQRQLSSAITRVAANGREAIKILDVATGAGRYVLDTIRIHKDAERIEAELRDFHRHNLEKSHSIAREWQLDNVSFVQHDAFDPNSYADRNATFDIAIVSGLFELFGDNDLVSKSLAAIRSTLRPGGVLLYTNQPWHPQLELIARVLPSHQGGKSWVMRRRTQAEMDQLVEQAGFKKSCMDIDEWGIFTVSTAVSR